MLFNSFPLFFVVVAIMPVAKDALLKSPINFLLLSFFTLFLAIHKYRRSLFI